MTQFEAITIWAAVVAYAIVTIMFVYMSVFETERGRRVALGAGVAGVVLHLASLVARYIYSGHIPVMGTYETTSAVAIFITLPTAIIAIKSTRLRMQMLAAAPIALFSLGIGLMSFDKGSPLTPAYRSTWLVIHVIFANLSYVAYSLAFATGIVYLIKAKKIAHGDSGKTFVDKFPALEELDDYIFRFVIFGFITSAFMIVAGAFWAEALWGSYWGWDPVETWSLISWLTYGLFIHLKIVHGWEGKRMAWLAILSLAFVLIAFWGVAMLPSSTQHRFSDIY